MDCDQDFPTTCQAHGDQHVAFKCFFCCNIATFFCGGKTHFCETCHKLGWGAVPMTIGECRPGCDGRHPDHGTKKIHCLGCVVCRSLGLNLNTKSAQSKERLAFVKVKKGLPHTAEEAAMAADLVELERLEEERKAAVKRAIDVQSLVDLRLSREEAEQLLDAHGGNIVGAVAERQRVLQKEEEQRASEAARDAAVEVLRAMGFRNNLEELHAVLISKSNNVERSIDALFEMQGVREGKVQALIALGWNEAAAQSFLEAKAWNQIDAEAALKEEKHRNQSQYPGYKGFAKRIFKILRKQHAACLMHRGAPCSCKGLEAFAPRLALPAACVVPVEDAEIEGFSGAFAMKKKPAHAGKQLFYSLQHHVALSVCDAANDGAKKAQEEAGDDDFFIVVKGSRRFCSENERAHARASESNESGGLGYYDEQDACSGDEADSLMEECLVEEFSGAFSRPRPVVRDSMVFEKLVCNVAEE